MILNIKFVNIALKKVKYINWKLLFVNGYLSVISAFVNIAILTYISKFEGITAANCILLNYFQSIASIFIFGLGSNFINQLVTAEILGNRQLTVNTIRTTIFLIICQSLFAQSIFIFTMDSYLTDLNAFSLILASTVITLGALINLFSQVLFALNKFKLEAHFNFFFVLSNVVSTFFGVLSGAGLQGFVYSKSVILFILLLIQFIFVRREFKSYSFLIPKKVSFGSVRNNVNGWYDFSINLANNFISNFPYLIVVKSLSSHQSIQLEIVKKLFEFLNSFAYRLSVPMTSFYARIYLLMEKSRLSFRILARTFCHQIILRSLFYTLVWVTTLIYFLIMSYDFYLILFLYSLTFYFSGISQIFGIFYNATGNQRDNFIFSLGILLITISGSLIVSFSTSAIWEIETTVYLLLLIMVNIVFIFRGSKRNQFSPSGVKRIE